MCYENVDLLPKEKIDLFMFRFKKRRTEKELNCYSSIYFSYGFISQNYNGTDEMGCPIFDGTYSLSDKFKRYKESRTKWIIAHIPNWLAIIISITTLVLNILDIV